MAQIMGWGYLTGLKETVSGLVSQNGPSESGSTLLITVSSRRTRRTLKPLGAANGCSAGRSAI